MQKENELFKINLQLFAEGNGEGDQGAQSEGGGEEGKGEEPKTYTQEEITAMKAQWEKEQKDALDKAKQEGLSEAERLAKLTAEERLQEELKKLQEQNNQYKEKEKKTELENEAKKCLEVEKLPTSFVSFVLGKDAETTKANIAAVKEIYNQEVQKAVEARLAGPTPPSGGSAATDDTAEKFKKALKGGF